MTTTTTNYGLTKPAISDNYDVTVQNGNMDIIDTQLKNNADITAGKLDKTGDASNVTVAFTQAATRVNLTTGEKLSVSLGKIMRFFTDLGTAAFSAASSFAAAVHTHTKSQITDFPSAMTPTAHKATHAVGGSDAISPSDLGNGYGTCSTAASTAAKAVTLSGFSLVVGGVIGVSFTYLNTATAATLNVNSSGAKSVYCNGSAVTATQIPQEALFQYDGTYWQLLNPIQLQSMSKLFSYTVGTSGGSISIDLSGIDMTQYSEIIVYGAIYGDTSNKGFYMTLNNMVGNMSVPYKDVYISSNSSSVSGGSTHFGYIPTEGYGGLTFPTSIMVKMRPIYINGGTQVSIDYSGGDALSGDAYSFIVVGAAGLFISNGKLTSIQFIESTGNIIAGSNFNVYGVKI